VVAQAQVDDIAAAALPVLRRSLGPVLGSRLSILRAEVVREGGRNLVVRCRVPHPAADAVAYDGAVPDVEAAASAASAPTSFVVKHLLPGQDLGFADWACLQFLAGVPGAATVVPRLIGGDAARRVFIMEDLGGSRSLDDVLQRGTPDDVVRAAAGVARATARLNGATVGQEGAFVAACARQPDTPVHHRHAEADRWLAALPRIATWIEAAGTSLPPDFHASAEHVATVYREPGDWLTFTHGDPAPTNTHLRPTDEGATGPPGDTVPPGDGDRVRLLDFEYGGYRHALYDITAWWALCPLPPDVEGAMRAAYRDQLALTHAPARDAHAFHRQWATLVAYRALAAISWVPLSALERDHEQVGSWTARQSLIARAERLHEAARDVAALAPLAAAGRALARGLRARWPEYAGNTRVLPEWGYERVLVHRRPT
jgi:thiamine kinase-like enzyme